MSRGRWFVVGVLVAAVMLLPRDLRAFCGFYVSGALLGLVAWLRGDGWKAWSHALLAPALGAIGVFAVLMANTSAWANARLVGSGASIFCACAGALLPLGLYVLIPRKS